jgi:hypothetical protein
VADLHNPRIIVEALQYVFEHAPGLRLVLERPGKLDEKCSETVPLDEGVQSVLDRLFFSM